MRCWRELFDRIADQVDVRFLHWILLLVLIVVVIVARFVISRILNVGHVDESLKTPKEGRARGAASPKLGMPKRKFGRMRRPPPAGQLWASK